MAVQGLMGFKGHQLQKPSHGHLIQNQAFFKGEVQLWELGKASVVIGMQGKTAGESTPSFFLQHGISIDYQALSLIVPAFMLVT